MEKYKVAKIISTKQLVINAGSNNHIKKGDIFDIIDTISDTPVIDPDTKKELGYLTLKKGTIEITDVYENMAIGEAVKTPLSAYQPGVKHDLNVDPTQITGGLPKSSGTKITVGDNVIKKLG